MGRIALFGVLLYSWANCSSLVAQEKLLVPDGRLYSTFPIENSFDKFKQETLIGFTRIIENVTESPRGVVDLTLVGLINEDKDGWSGKVTLGFVSRSSGWVNLERFEQSNSKNEMIGLIDGK
ncbi:hypothetical protein [Lacunimicrobium album]